MSQVKVWSGRVSVLGRRHAVNVNKTASLSSPNMVSIHVRRFVKQRKMWHLRR